MIRYIYIITDKALHNLHVGLCSNLTKTLEFYRQMPTLFFDQSQQLNKLIYFEQIEGERASLVRYAELSIYTRAEKLNLIKKQNPELKEIDINDVYPHKKG